MPGSRSKLLPLLLLPLQKRHQRLRQCFRVAQLRRVAGGERPDEGLGNKLPHAPLGQQHDGAVVGGFHGEAGQGAEAGRGQFGQDGPGAFGLGREFFRRRQGAVRRTIVEEDRRGLFRRDGARQAVVRIDDAVADAFGKPGWPSSDFCSSPKVMPDGSTLRP